MRATASDARAALVARHGVGSATTAETVAATMERWGPMGRALPERRSSAWTPGGYVPTLRGMARRSYSGGVGPVAGVLAAVATARPAGQDSPCESRCAPRTHETGGPYVPRPATGNRF